MVEAPISSTPIDAIPSACVPFYLLTPNQRTVLQYVSEGLTSSEIGTKKGGNSRRTVETHKRNIRSIGYIDSNIYFPDEYENQERLTLLALIRDGISHGYLTHDLPQMPVQTLTPREKEVLELAAQGKRHSEIARALNIAQKTVEAHMGNVHKKLHTKNTYHALARTTYLTIHNLWPTPAETSQASCHKQD